jgi:Mn2+/Fe2+ NRAMP family transporter
MKNDLVAVILAVSAGLAINLLIIAGIVKEITTHGEWVISDNYVTLISGTLGALVGGLAVYLGTSVYLVTRREPPSKDD